MGAGASEDRTQAVQAGLGASRERGGPSWDGVVDESLDRIRGRGRWRAPVIFDGAGQSGLLFGTGGDRDSRAVVTFGSNDYLGLSCHPAVVDAAAQAGALWGSGSGGARLLTGTRPVHEDLEVELARWKSSERAVLFPTGYQANVGVVTALAAAARGASGLPVGEGYSGGVGESRPAEESEREREARVAGSGLLVCSDELNHASIIDGCRIARADVAAYPHRDLERLEKLLCGHAGLSMVVSDLVFSVDGDIAPVWGLMDVCARHGSLLVLDEAHCVLGGDPVTEARSGRGAGRVGHGTERGASCFGEAETVPQLGAARPVVLRVGTLSKFLGSQGGFVAGPARYVDLLVNTARSYIFTTALAPPAAAAALAALRILGSAEGRGLIDRLAGHVERVAPGHDTQIVSVVVGAEKDALAASRRLLERGIWVPAIRPPTVPAGTSRLRISLSAAHTDEQVDSLRASLAELGLVAGAIPA